MYTEKDIMDELRKFVHSKEGQKYLADQGVSVGGYSQEEIVRISEELRQKIIDGYYNAITENRSEASQSIEEFIVGSPVKRASGSWQINLSISEKHLYRPSLHKEGSRNEYTGEGIKDIIALITSGYKTNGRVYGYWVDWSYTRGYERKFGTRRVHSGEDMGEKSVLISNKVRREPNPFIKRIVEEFNEKYTTILVKFPAEWGGEE